MLVFEVRGFCLWQLILSFCTTVYSSSKPIAAEKHQLGHARHERHAPLPAANHSESNGMNIAFDLPDITTTIEIPSGTAHLEAFKSLNNDKILIAPAGLHTSKLNWVSIGYPNLVKTLKTTNSSYLELFHFTKQGFFTRIEMMTDTQRSALAEAARFKYELNISDQQVVPMSLSRFRCSLVLFDESGTKYLLVGNVSDFWHFPLRMDFDASSKSIERKLFLELINANEDDLHFDCHIESIGGKIVKTNTLTITYGQQQQIQLEEKLFGPTGSNASDYVYVTRNQMFGLAHELHKTLNIIEDYQMPENQFSEPFINDLVSQIGSSHFSQVPIDTVLTSLSKYGIDVSADFHPDVIKRQAESILKVDQVESKSRIVRDESKHRESASSGAASGGNSLGIRKLFSASDNWAGSNSQSSSSDDRSLDDQLRELNKASQNEAQWEFEGNKVVPKSLNVARLLKSNLKKTLVFNRILLQTFLAPFQRDFKLYTLRSTVSVSLDDSDRKLQAMYQNFSSDSKRIEASVQSISQKVPSMLQMMFKNFSSSMKDLQDMAKKTNNLQKHLSRIGCPCGFEFQPEAETCIKMVYERLDWFGADSVCRKMMPGVHLVAITSASKQEAVARYLQQEFNQARKDICESSVWTSGQTQDPNRCDSQFVWRTSPTMNSPFNYTNWRDQEPNCANDKEHCVQIPLQHGPGGGWNDLNCKWKGCALCEIETNV